MAEAVRLSHESAEYAHRYERAENRTPFAHPAFIRAVGDVFNLGVDTWTAGTATVTSWHRRVGPFRRFSHPAFCYYSPAIIQAGFGSDDLILAAYPTGARRLQIPPGIVLADVGAVRIRTFRTFLIESDNLEPSAWSASQRRLFVRSRADYQMRDALPDEVVHRSNEAYRRHDRQTPFATNRMSRLLTRLKDDGLVELYALDGPTVQAEAALALLMDDRRAYYWLAGSVPGPAMTVLLGEALSHVKARGLGLDFLGANTPSIAEFKRRFGGTIAPHFHVEIPPSGAIESVRRIFRRR